jgi:NADH-quinone oxidoreductase subunit M
VTELHLPWLELCVLIPLVGSLWVSRYREPAVARYHALAFALVTLALATGAWVDFIVMRVSEAGDRFHLSTLLFQRELLKLDEISAPLLPLGALLFAVTMIATVRSKARRFSFTWTLLSEAIVLATFCCKEPWVLIGLLSLGTLPPLFELRARGRNTNMYVAHMGLFVILLVVGWSVVMVEGTQTKVHSLLAILPLLTAVLIRTGIVPFHGWLPDLFEKSSFGSAILFATPLVGVYAAVRLVLPIAPDWIMRSMGLISLFTAVYGGAMALVQTEGRRFFSYLFISHAAVILVGLEVVTPLTLTGALCVWLSVALSLTGFGLTLRAVEARRGRLLLTSYQGLYEQMPLVAVCFLLTGLASVGFPGTIGYIGSELLVDAAAHVEESTHGGCDLGKYTFVGITLAIAAAFSGIAVVHAYFLLFTGTRQVSSISLRMGRREKIAFLTIIAILLIGGILPQVNVQARYHAAVELLNYRGIITDTDTAAPWDDDDDDDDDDDWDEDDDDEDDDDDAPVRPGMRARPRNR